MAKLFVKGHEVDGSGEDACLGKQVKLFCGSGEQFWGYVGVDDAERMGRECEYGRLQVADGGFALQRVEQETMT
jgi:hypothetical protein